jgi:hypothetical protein
VTAGEAFREAIMQRPNQAVSIANLWPAIKSRLQAGYKAPKNAVNAAARRLAEDKSEPSIKRLDDGRYIYSVEAVEIAGVNLPEDIVEATLNASRVLNEPAHGRLGALTMLPAAQAEG